MGKQVFGSGNVDFKEGLLEWITEQCDERRIDSLQAIEDVLEVVSHLARHAHRRDAAIRNLYEQAKRDAREELVSQLR
jgi:hypothetical protein